MKIAWSRKANFPQFLPKQLAKYERWLASHARNLTLVGGSVVVATWTVLRHITNGVNFDVVGQVGLAEQWATRHAAGSQLGATNYLLKIPLYMFINQFRHISPSNRLLLLALIFNVATFILLFVLYEKIMDLYNVKRRSWLYLAMAWYATIFGGLYWADYANSRNLETVGGVLLTYLALKYLKTWRRATLALVGLFSCLVFFADPLQFYVVGVGLCVFLAYRWYRYRTSTVTGLPLVVVTLLAYLVSRLLLLIAKRMLSINVLATPAGRQSLSIANLWAGLQGLITSTLKLFDADVFRHTYDLGSIRSVLNLVVLCVLFSLLIRSWRKLKPRVVLGLVVIIIAINYVLYIASGQVLEWETSRYLIMVPLFVLLLVAASGDALDAGVYRLRLQRGWLSIIVIVAVMLVGGVVHNWPTRNDKDQHVQNLISFMQTNHFHYALASREAGITTSYFSDDSVHVLPMGCTANHQLAPTDLFYDDAAFKGLYGYFTAVPVIVPADGIQFGQNVCTRQNIVAQFGVPEQAIPIAGIGTALVYDPDDLATPFFDHLVGHPRPPSPIKLKKAAQDLATATLQAPQTNLAKLTDCKNGAAEVIVAHPDDDILFMNPSLSAQISSGSCVRSVYVTAADDGRPQEYWLYRERGIEAAYAAMLHADNNWHEQTVVVYGNAVSVRSLQGHPEIGLVFLRLPDGNVHGEGFVRTGNVSLKKMAQKPNLVVPAIDNSTSYTYLGLTNTLSIILKLDQPATIFTHVSSGDLINGDHSDHTVVGALALQAAAMAKSTAAIRTYVGYPSNNLPPNVSVSDASQKRSIFYAYASDDKVICKTAQYCSIEGTYGKYFARSYEIDQAAPVVLPLITTPPIATPVKPQPKAKPKTSHPSSLFSKAV